MAAPAAELQLEDMAGEDGDLEGGLEGSLHTCQSAEAATPDVLAGQPAVLLLFMLLFTLLLLLLCLKLLLNCSTFSSLFPSIQRLVTCL